MLGIGYSTYAVIYWESIPYLVKGKVTGAAFGIANTFKNIAIVFAAPLIGWMIDKLGDYEKVQQLFMVTSLAALLFNA